MDKNKYKETASAIEEYVCGQLAGKYLQAAQDIDQCGGDIAHHLKQLENRSREYHNPSFVVLVVGPVKSGKSTFVNLVARNYVSPTHFLECTVRPSLIFAGSEEKLTVYRSTDASHKEQQTNSIIDSINGLAEESGLANVRKEVYAHTRKNIDRYVKLGNVSVDKDDILLTSIETHGGKLLQDHVYLVDMAGFDGDRVNFDTPAYKAIIERADLIVFVQSSNSAISKLSASFFELLQKKNHSVPVCLVHNVFESAYWRDEESKQRDIEEQKEYAVEQIKAKYNLVLDEGYAFNLNLGKVDDWRNGNFRPELKESLEQEAARFEQAESAMYELFRKRESIRLANCIARTSIQRDVLLEHVREAIRQKQEQEKQYQEVAQGFEALKRTRLDDSPTVMVSEQELTQIVNEEYYTIRKFVEARGENTSFKTSEVRGFVHRMLEGIYSRMTRLVNEKRRQFLQMQYGQEFQQWQVALLQLSAHHLSQPNVSVECPLEDITVDWGAGVNVEELVAHKSMWYKHSTDSVNDYFAYVHDAYCGFETSADTKAKGLIANELLHKANSLISAALNQVKSQLTGGMNHEIERLKRLSLATITPDHDAFTAHVALLQSLEKDLEALNIHIHE